MSWRGLIPALILLTGLAGAGAAQAQGRGRGNGGGGGEPTGFGNNLSYPVVFAEGYGVTGLQIPVTTTWSPPYQTPYPTPGDATGLRPLAGETFTTFPSLTDPYPENPGFFAQNTVNTWRAQWGVGTPGTPEQVQVDWGDNLISQSWTATQPVRVEVVLRQPIPMLGYPMTSLLGSRRNEVQGTTGVAELSLGRTVYSITGHLIIQKYNSTWSAVVPNGCSVDEAVYSASGEGPGGFAAEVNVSGAVIYGFNWMLSQCSPAPDSAKTGNWRITFQLDPVATLTSGSVARNAEIVGAADLSSPITTVTWGPYASSLDIAILATRPKGGGRGRQ